ncbi:MAG: site-2 protease family protein [Anaerolineae bacterium]|jgi:Zn-dependent protease
MKVNSEASKKNLRTIPLGHVFGIPIGAHYSWFTILVLLTWVLAVSYYPAEFHDWSAVLYWIMGALTAILLFVAVLVHELGHAVVAQRYKVPVRGITLFIFGGVAQMGEEPPNAVAEFWIAVAGPLVSFALAAVLGLLQAALSGVAPLLALTKYLAYVNGTLALFNLIPGFPLDGGRVFRAVMWAITHNLQRATLLAANLGRGVSLLFIVVGVWQLIDGNIGTGLWIAFIGWFLETAARAEVRRQEIQGLLAGRRTAEAMDADPAFIAAGTTLQQLVDRFIRVAGQCSFVVEANDHPVGLLTLHQIKGVPRSEWPTTPAARIMIPATRAKSIGPDSELSIVLQQMDRSGATQLPVMANGRIVGMLTREDIMRFLRTLREKPCHSE